MTHVSAAVARCVAVILLAPHAAAAQSSAPTSTKVSAGTPSQHAIPPRLAARPVGGSEWVVGAGGAASVNLFQSKRGRHYVVQTVSWGRELTRDYGPGVLRGRFAWAIEVTPVFRELQPSRAYGIGVAPVLWRWNFVPRPRWSGFGEMAVGGLWSSAPIPEQTTRANFTAHWGAGVRIGGARGRSLVLAYRFQHISNGNQLSSNPGVNSHLAFVGWSVSRRR